MSEQRTVKVTSSLKWGVAKDTERFVGLIVATLRDKPTGRLGAEVHLGHDDQCGHTSLSESVSIDYVPIEGARLLTLPSIRRQLRPVMPEGSGTL